MSDNFWEEFASTFVVDSAIDRVLQGRTMGGSSAVSMRDLTDKYRAANALQAPYNAGQRVSFIANVGSVLTYDNVPGDNIDGTIIKVKSGGEKATSQGDLVYVQWDDGHFRSILAEHLRPGSSNRKVAQNVALRVADFSLVSQFFNMHSASSDELVHRATKDLWSFRKDSDTGYVIERLFDYKGVPLKV